MALKGRTVVRILVLAVAIGVLGWNFWRAHNAPAPSAATPVAAAPGPETGLPAAAATVATQRRAPAKPLKLGRLTFKPCELEQPNSGATTAAWCAPFGVPEDRAHPHGRRIQLKLALIKSDAAVADADIVVYLAGGPGQSAIQTWPQIAPALAPLRKHHHILLLDQRGTGGSHPLACKQEQEKLSKETAASFDLSEIRKATAACLAEVRSTADPRFYTTTVATQDLEDVRQALGTPQFDLIGVSYGTRMAQQYLMRHSEGVRSVVLDSVVPNQLVLGEDFARNLEQALRKQFALCTHTPGCKQRFGDPYRTLYQLRDALRANPHKVSFRDPLSYKTVTQVLNEYALASVVRLFAYTPETAALLPVTLDAAAHGDVGPLLGQAKLITGDLNDSMNGGMQLSVICSEDADLLKPRPADADTILGNKLIEALKTQCEVWPHGSRPADFHQPLKSATPVLILSGAFDPVTPPRYGKQILQGLSHGRQLIVKGQGHNVVGRGCMPGLVREFVEKLDPKTLDAGCLDVLGPTPPFIDFNGAAP